MYSQNTELLTPGVIGASPVIRFQFHVHRRKVVAHFFISVFCCIYFQAETGIKISSFSFFSGILWDNRIMHWANRYWLICLPVFSRTTQHVTQVSCSFLVQAWILSSWTWASPTTLTEQCPTTRRLSMLRISLFLQVRLDSHVDALFLIWTPVLCLKSLITHLFYYLLCKLVSVHQQ